VTLPVTGVTFTTPYGAANTALVDIPVSINVLAGTYYVSVTPSLDFNAGGEIGVIVTGTGDAYQVNPGGGFGLPGNINASSGNAGYEGTAL
jgi:hypothetical protein